MLALHQRLSLQQKLSPQQIQYQKLLQLNTLALEQRIKTELELNPILEELIADTVEETIDQKEDSGDDSGDDDEYSDSADEFDAEDYMNEADFDESEISRLNRSAEDDDRMQPVARERITLSELLIDQLHLMGLSEDLMYLGEVIISNLEDGGYFKQDLQKIINDLRLFEQIDINLEDAEKLLKQIQLLEPVGIACRTLQECLLVQLRNETYDPYYSYLAEQILENHFKDFVNKRYDAIQKNMNLSVETLRSSLEIIHRLNPKPGEGNIESDQANQVTPDFLIEKIDNNFIITLNDRSVPSVTISQTYLEMLDGNKRKRNIQPREKEAHKFLREKFESAKWFIASIQQRRDTLMRIMRTILEKQYDFFEFGPKALRPMIYKDIADEIQMDISTISRVVNGKYVQSPVGIHELKYFFSEGLATDSGREISNKHIKELIKDLCDGESKKTPLSDDKIAAILVGKGIHIARRTVAKYREQLFIPVARLRKEL